VFLYFQAFSASSMDYRSHFNSAWKKLRSQRRIFREFKPVNKASPESGFASLNFLVVRADDVKDATGNRALDTFRSLG